jgi:hypothetical protein
MHQLQFFIESHGLQRQMCALFSGKRRIHPRLCRSLLGMYCCGEEQQTRQPIEPFPRPSPMKMTRRKRGWLSFLCYVHVSPESFYIR